MAKIVAASSKFFAFVLKPPDKAEATPDMALIIFKLTFAHCISLLAQNKPQSVEAKPLQSDKPIKSRTVPVVVLSEAISDFQQCALATLGLLQTFFTNYIKRHKHLFRDISGSILLKYY